MTAHFATPGPLPLELRALDALQELASIGSGHAVTALAKLTGVRFDMDVPEAWVGRSAGAIADFLGTLDRDIVAVGLRLGGVLAGHLVMALTDLDARRLAKHLGHPAPESGAWDLMADSAIMESGNIVASAFVSAIANMLGDRLLPSIPSLAHGGGRDCLDRLMDRETSRVALATRFMTRGPDMLEGLILVIPDERELPALLAALESVGRT
jgi:chemotaxis protein CheC